MKKVTKIELCWIAQLIVILTLCWIYSLFGVSEKDPLVICSIYLVIILPILWSWRNSKTEFLKRFTLALPFVLILWSIFKLTGFETLSSIYSSMALLLFMIIKAVKWKVHFVVTFTVALIFALLLIYIKNAERTIYMAYIVSIILLPLISFYLSYISAIGGKEPIKFSSLFLRSVKYAIVLILALYLLLWNQLLGRKYDINFMISFGISCLIALGFWGVCKYFNINLADPSSKKMNLKKTNQDGVCECCGKSGIPKEFLFKTRKGQRVCASCLKNMDDSNSV